jgi:hypothetical protein
MMKRSKKPHTRRSRAEKVPIYKQADSVARINGLHCREVRSWTWRRQVGQIGGVGSPILWPHASIRIQVEPLTHQTTGRGRPAPFRRPRAPPGISGLQMDGPTMCVLEKLMYQPHRQATRTRRRRRRPRVLS